MATGKRDRPLTIRELLLEFLEFRLSWTSLILSVVALFSLAILLPNALSLVGLNMNEDWPTTTNAIVQLTLGSWCATFTSSAARVYVWLQAKYAGYTGTQYTDRRDELKMIQNLFLWILGVMTVLSGYVTSWFNGG